MFLKLSKNIEIPSSTEGGDYTLLKKDEVQVGFVLTIDDQAKSINITPKFYRINGTWIDSVNIPAVNIYEGSVFVNAASILEKNAYSNYVVYPEMNQKTLDLVLSSELNKVALSNYVVLPLKA